MEVLYPGVLVRSSGAHVGVLGTFCHALLAGAMVHRQKRGTEDDPSNSLFSDDVGGGKRRHGPRRTGASRRRTEKAGA